MGNYTLLADDNCAYSKESALYQRFRAHIIFNVITNGDITLSDNQVMSSPNLRTLMRRDGVIRELVKQQHVTLAVRREPKRGILPLEVTFQAFLAEGKLPEGYRDIAESPEIAFLELHAHKIGWAYFDVRTSFTEGCKSVIFDQLGRKIPGHLDTLRSIIAEEELRDDGLGRAFLQMRMPAILERYGMLDEQEAKVLLQTYSDAVYLSNLPRTMGLNPVYAEEHRPSFELVRGIETRWEGYGETLDLQPKLAAEHFLHGLNQLDIDDIHEIQRSDAYRAFSYLSGADDPLAAFDELFIVYRELNRVIEDRIIMRFRYLLRNSPAPDPRRMRKRYGTVFENSVAIATDILSFAELIPSVPGVIASYLVDVVRKRIEPERPHVDAARHDLEMHRLQRYLESHGSCERMVFGEEIAQTRSFDKEIIVA